jgi:hypothetical protein
LFQVVVAVAELVAVAVVLAAYLPIQINRCSHLQLTTLRLVAVALVVVVAQTQVETIHNLHH